MSYPISPVETYLHDIREIHNSQAGVPETSYYGKLESLLNAAGAGLKPKVRCIINIQNCGAGIPDGGFFTSDQLDLGSDIEWKGGQIPARGVLEVKGAVEDVDNIAQSPQVKRYLDRYGQVLVTNLRDFLLVQKDANGSPLFLERYTLAEDEVQFWSASQSPHEIAVVHGDRLIDYLRRVMLMAAPLADPKDLAWFLASYAREARARIEVVDQSNLDELRAAIVEALGISFQGTKGEQFFRSTLVQTLFYGVFSAWVLWCRQSNSQGGNKFDWRTSAYLLQVPVIRLLFERIATRSQLDRLNLFEVLNWTGDTLDRVDRTAFFDRFGAEHAVQYFYEPFLAAFDPELRKELGVWYTPHEIVRYQVERVDTVLREELGIVDGLADPRVYVLDPGCGTGAYLVEVLRRIHRTLSEHGSDALVSHDVKRAAISRVFGFEILTAPFVIAHLQVGLFLDTIGAPLSSSPDERARVYLTNSLIGWEPLEHESARQLVLPELQAEREAAEEIKRTKPILVVLGNPPYNAFAGVSPTEESDLVALYKDGLISEWGVKKFNLDELYVRFFRLAERRIAEVTGKGIVCYISSFSYLSDQSFVVMRKRFLQEFDRLWFDCLNGDSRETGKRTPEGKPDPSVFSTQYNREGIRVGTAIALMVRKEVRDQKPTTLFRQFWGVNKRAELVESLNATSFDSQYQAAEPVKSNRFSFRPVHVAQKYLLWPKLVELCAELPSNGLMEKRKGALIDIDREALEQRMRMYYDSNIDWHALSNQRSGLTNNAARFDARKARAKILAAESFVIDQIKRYAIRPMETIWCYYSSTRPLWNEPRPQLWAQCWQGNSFLLSRISASKSPEGSPFYFASGLSDDHLLSPDSSCFPLRLRSQRGKNKGDRQIDMVASGDVPVTANLSSSARVYLTSLGINAPDVDAEVAGLIWMHALAIGYAPSYLAENRDGIRGDWPRIPLPSLAEHLVVSAELGRDVAGLLDTEIQVVGVTGGRIRTELRLIAQITAVGGRALQPGQDLALTAHWGRLGKTGAVMPGTGRIVARDYTLQEIASIHEGAVLSGLSSDEALSRLGASTYDIYLNDRAYWSNVPCNVWEYVIGGYQVIKKWLSYREREILKRPLSSDEVREAMNIARRIAAILLLESALDENYHRIKDATYSWSKGTEA